MNEEIKENIYAHGEVTFFTFSNNEKYLFFEGNLEDEKNSFLKRKIKISKYVQGYKNAERHPLDKANFPTQNKKYLMNLVLESWEWQKHNCLRVIAFEIEKDLGENKKVNILTNKTNPFLKRKENNG